MSKKFSEIVEEYFNYRKDDYRITSFYTLKGKANNHLVRCFGNLNFEDISFDDLMLWKRSKIELNLRHSTLKQLMLVLKGIYTYAETLYNYKNLAKLLTPFKKNDIKYRANIYTAKDISKLLVVVPYNDFKVKIMILLMFLLGMRKSEVFGLRKECVDFERKVIIVNLVYNSDYQAFGGPKSDSSIRILPFNSMLERYLRIYVKNTKLETTIFKGKIYKDLLFYKKISYTTFLRRLRDYSNRAKIKYISPHCYRHSYNNILYVHGVDEKTRQSLLGHSDIMTTQNIYTKYQDDNLKRANKIIEDELLAKAKKK